MPHKNKSNSFNNFNADSFIKPKASKEAQFQIGTLVKKVVFNREDCDQCKLGIVVKLTATNYKLPYYVPVRWLTKKADECYHVQFKYCITAIEELDIIG